MAYHDALVPVVMATSLVYEVVPQAKVVILGGPVFANFGSSVRVTGMITGHFDPLVGQSTTYVTDWRAVRDNYGARLIYG